MQNSSSTKSTALWIIATLIVAVSVFAIVKIASKSSGETPETSTIPANVSEVTDLDQTKGNKSSKIILVEYSDFQCPACAAYSPLVKQINNEMSEKILFVYRHFPLAQHKNARPAAYAAEAAGRQGKFWEMHDMIFENQLSWSKSSPGEAEDTFGTYAEKLGLNMEQFKTDRESDEVEEKVDNDYKSGTSSGVPGTPAFFVNGKKLPNPRSYEEFKQLIEYVGSNP